MSKAIKICNRKTKFGISVILKKIVSNASKIIMRPESLANCVTSGPPNLYLKVWMTSSNRSNYALN